MNIVNTTTQDIFSPLDILEEADIHLRYTTVEPGNQDARRRKRHASNMLTDLLNNIDWHANVSLSVGYNRDDVTGREASNISLHRYTSLQNLIKWDTSKDVNGTQANLTNSFDKTFTWDCVSCYGNTIFNYVL